MRRPKKEKTFDVLNRDLCPGMILGGNRFICVILGVVPCEDFDDHLRITFIDMEAGKDQELRSETCWKNQIFTGRVRFTYTLEG